MINFPSINEYIKNLSNNNNQRLRYSISPAKSDEPEIKKTSSKDELCSELNYAKRQNGLIEKVADAIKSALNFGANSKQIQKSIDSNEDKNAVETKIKKYRASQENTAQAAADIVSCLASIFGFFRIKQAAQIKIAQKYHLNEENIENFVKNIELGLSNEMFSDKLKNLNLSENIPKIMKSSKTPIAIAAIGTMLIGALTKKYFLKINRIATTQYKAEISKDMDKKEKKIAKKKAARNRSHADFRNWVSGAINGLTTPLLALGGVGAPLYLIANSLNRYFVATREDRHEKSVNSYIENLKTSPLPHIISALAILIPVLKQQSSDKIFNQNYSKVLEKLKKAELQDTLEFKSTYKQLEETIFADEKIKDIVNGKIPGYTAQQLENMPESQKLDAQVNAIINENIFAAKFKQIEGGSDALTEALKEKCPPTWSAKEAQANIDKAFGAGKYTITSPCGAGTVAETYIVKDASGKEYCIKMLKKGISREKIQADRDRCADLINALTNKTREEKEYLIKNLDDIAKSVIDEADLSNEMKAADELRKVTKKAKIVQGIEVKDNIYVMEKAKGVSLKTLTDYYTKKDSIEQQVAVAEMMKKIPGMGENLADELQKSIDMNQARLKEFEALEKEMGGEMSKARAQKLIEKYQDVLVEQFSKVDGNGKIIHGDIHAGNIFIDGKDITLIDTGNVIRLSSEQAIRFMNLTKYIQNADFDNITAFALDEAKLPAGMTMDEASKMISKELQTIFFDDKTHTGVISNDRMMSIIDGLLKKHGIIPGGTQAALAKTKTAAKDSLDKFSDTFMNALAKKLLNGLSDVVDKSRTQQTVSATKELGQFTFDIAKTKARYPLKQSIREKLNLFKMSPIERAKIKRSPSTPKFNSEDYLTYTIKQHKILKGNSDFFE